jgi:hypothetical protein
MVQVPGRDTSMEIWWNLGVAAALAKEEQQRAAIMIYTAWNVWKEMDRRVFEGVALQKGESLSLLKRRWRCGSANQRL